MHLYSVTLQKSTAITQAIYGSFSAPKTQEIVVSRGKLLELMRPDENGKLQTIVSTEVFGIIRSLAPFRLTGGNKDYVVVGSDSGRIVILEFDVPTNRFVRIHQETYGKSGCRRAVPGEFLAHDPKGRAIMIGAVEKQKLVYVMNRDASNRLTISSPLEAHKASTLVLAMTGVDVGFDNPVFACLELDYSDADSDPTGEAAQETTKMLTYYELDLGLNHVTRRWQEPVDRTANLLVTVPGGGDGPSGVLVCSEDWISFKHENHPEVRTRFPRRCGTPADKGVLIVSAATHRQKRMFFFLLQTELGDLLKVSLDVQDEMVSDLRVSFFDTIPVANSLCITRTGLLFCASEFGNHVLYQFQGIGDEEDAVSASAIDFAALSQAAAEHGLDTQDADQLLSLLPPPPQHQLRPLANLAILDELDSLSPATSLLVADLCGEDTPQIAVACGRGHRSSLRLLRHGLRVNEVAVSPLPGNPNAVWSTRGSNNDAYDRYIVVSFTNATLVLAIGAKVEEVQDSGFLGTQPTLQVQLLEDGALLQVHSQGIRHIRADRGVTEWKTPGKKVVERAATNSRQVAVSLAGGEIIYFELDASGSLVEQHTKDFGAEVCSLDLGEVPAGRQRAPFLAVGGLDSTVRLLSLEPADLLAQRSTLALQAAPDSLCLSLIGDEGEAQDPAAAAAAAAAGGAPRGAAELYLSIGLRNGVLMRNRVDPSTGNLTDSRTRFLGSRPVRLSRVRVGGRVSVLALSSRPWLAYEHQGRLQITPLSYDALEFGGSFSSEQCPEGIVAVAGDTLRIATLDRLGEVFNQTSTPLRYTPRRVVHHPTSGLVAVVEADHNTFSKEMRAAVEAEAGVVDPAAAAAQAKAAARAERMETEGEEEEEEEGEEEEEEEEIPTTNGPPPPVPGVWGSCVRLIDPTSLETRCVVEMENNECALSAAAVVFHHRGQEAFLLVGGARNMQLMPRGHDGGFILCYRVVEGGQLVLVHKTPLEEVPLAITAFQGRVLVGCGRTLRIYDLGKRKLLRKCENKGFPTLITSLSVTGSGAGERVVVGDGSDGVIMVRYKRQSNTLVIFADELVPRMVTAATALDSDTVMAADKFGSLFALRLPASATDDVDNPTGNRILWDTGVLSGAPHKLETMAQFYTGELVTCLTKSALVPGGSEAVIYTTVTGAVGALLPFSSREDLDFCSHLEMYLRQDAEHASLIGREHLSYRSYFSPLKEVVDGDLCESFARLPAPKQRAVAEELDRTPAEVLKKLEDLRNRLM